MEVIVVGFRITGALSQAPGVPFGSPEHLLHCSGKRTGLFHLDGTEGGGESNRFFRSVVQPSGQVGGEGGVPPERTMSSVL